MRHTKLTALFLALLLALSLTLPASADVLWEPDNRFYENHRGDCEYHNRSYTANSPQGYVDVRSAPDGVVIAQVENGQRLNVYFLYQDWGYVNTASTEGWAPLSDLALIYDDRSFEEEHGDEILPVDKALTDPFFDAYLKTGKTTLVIWPYPNAEHFSHHYTGDQGLELLNALKEYGVFTYTDEEGQPLTTGEPTLPGEEGQPGDPINLPADPVDGGGNTRDPLLPEGGGPGGEDNPGEGADPDQTAGPGQAENPDQTENPGEGTAPGDTPADVPPELPEEPDVPSFEDEPPGWL